MLTDCVAGAPRAGPTVLDWHWLKKWTALVSGAPHHPMVPLEARRITTPLIVTVWRQFLLGHPDQDLVYFLLTGIAQGFRIGYNCTGNPLKSATRNMHSALRHPEIVNQYLTTEVNESRVVGPYPKTATPEAHMSRFGVIPKGHQTGKWRLIVDLSHPNGGSINDGIPKDLCSMSYINIDAAIDKTVALGQGTQRVKIDIKSAFRLIPVHPADRHLLAMEWNGNIFIDTCLPIGLRSASKLFNRLPSMDIEAARCLLCHTLPGRLPDSRGPGGLRMPAKLGHTNTGMPAIRSPASPGKSCRPNANS